MEFYVAGFIAITILASIVVLDIGIGVARSILASHVEQPMIGDSDYVSILDPRD